jgi:PilZ domain-containing protein
MQQGTKHFLDWGTIKSIAKRAVLLLHSSNLQQSTNRRLPAKLMVFVSWQSDGIHKMFGLIRNISRTGMFFEAEQEIPIGTKIDLSFSLRQASSEDTFRCAGTVVRVQRIAESKIGIGVEISKSELDGSYIPLASILFRRVGALVYAVKVTRDHTAIDGRPGGFVTGS